MQIDETCGKSGKKEECVSMKSCNKDVRGHLRSYNVFDGRIDSEIVLIMARAGMLENL